MNYPNFWNGLLDSLLPQNYSSFLEEDWQNIYHNKNILITGAGGYIGQGLVRQLIGCDPKSIIACDHSEIGLHQLHSNYEQTGDALSKIRFVLGSVADRQILKNIFGMVRPDIVIHAAAYKHVPLVQSNPYAGYVNNLFSFWEVMTMACQFESEHCVLISSDKAINPNSVMGASKHLTELLLFYQSLMQSKTNLKVVRFGNVIGSSGSLVPKVLDQLVRGQDVTLTSKAAYRYFMSLNDATTLTLNAIKLSSQSGDVFHLDMGPMIHVEALIGRIIQYYRDHVDANCRSQIKEVGLYPGERLTEPCLIDANCIKTSHQRIYKYPLNLPMPLEEFGQVWQSVLQDFKDGGFDESSLLRLLKNSNVILSV